MRSALVVLLLATAVPSIRAQCTPQPGSIPNFRGSATPTSFTLEWDPPANPPPNAVYEILEETGPDYCSLSNQFAIIATTTATTFTGAKPQSNTVYGGFVRLQSNPCIQVDRVLVTDSFTTPPPKPAITRIDTTRSSATIIFSYSSPKTLLVKAFRAPAGGRYTKVPGSVQPCGPDPKSLVDSNLAPGVYTYIIGVSDDGNVTGANGIFSDPVTIFVGFAPSIESFTGSPLTIRAGQNATLSFSVAGATSTFIDQGIGSVPASGAVTVTPKTTTTYTLTATNANGTSTQTVTINVFTAPLVGVGKLPEAIVQAAGVGGGTATYKLSNAGGGSTTITLGQSGTFFTQSPASFTLAPGASQVVTITGTPQAAGVQEGASLPTGAGVPAGVQVPIRLLSVVPPTGAVSARAAKNRVDVSAPIGVTPVDSVSYVNNGATTLQGVLVSDVPWIIPQSGIVTIPPGGTGTFTFICDRSKRPDSDAPAGSTRGNLVLTFPSGTPLGKKASLDTGGTSVSTVTVIDTVKPNSNPGAPPPLALNEVALFVPGVGHVQGGAGLFISDLSILNPIGTKIINDLKMFYTPVGTSSAAALSAPLPNLSSNVSVALADVAQNVFGNQGVASLQIRSADAAKLAVSTNIFNTSFAAGTYGTAIPTFRSDRAVVAGDSLVLTGLRADTSAHTNLFIQETSGNTVTVQTQFFDLNGTSLGTRTDTAGPFALLQINSQVPNGGVSAIMTNSGATPGNFLAYATPVDNNSGDNWAVADWARQSNNASTDPTVIPVAGSVFGANGTFFRTDFAIMNSGTTSGSGTLRYLPRGGTPIDKTISLGAHQSNVISDIIGTGMFNAAGTIGFLTFTPVSGTFAVTSRTFSTDTRGITSGTFGSGVPSVATTAALVPGSFRAIGNLADAAPSSVLAGRPATFRTNMGLMETSGASVTVRVTLRFTFQLAKVAGIASASKDYTLAPFQFMQVPMVSDIIGDANRATLPDLQDIEADFQVISGPGTAVIYTSSTDNGTGDLILRTE